MFSLNMWFYDIFNLSLKRPSLFINQLFRASIVYSIEASFIKIAVLIINWFLQQPNFPIVGGAIAFTCQFSKLRVMNFNRIDI